MDINTMILAGITAVAFVISILVLITAIIELLRSMNE